MRALRERIRLVDRASDDRGLTIIEVVVAMFVFAVISTGILATMLSTVSVTRDARSRHVAANLASEQVDRVRSDFDLSVENPPATRTSTVNGETYTISTALSYQSTTTSTAQCGTGGEPIRFISVHVGVTWNNMRAGTQPVVNDTILSPASRLNQSGLGTIVVSVGTTAGLPLSDVAVTVTPKTGGAKAITTTITPTTVQGCTTIFNVTPGTYTVGVSKSGYVDATLNANPKKDVVVSSQAVALAAFEMLTGAAVKMTYASNSTNSSLLLPNGFTTTIRSVGTTQRELHTGAPNTTKTYTTGLPPSANAYEFIAGDVTATCPAVDPAAWSPITKNGVTYTSSTAKQLATQGVTNSVNVPMGIVTIKKSQLASLLTSILGVLGTTYYIVAVPQNDTVNTPGCSSATALQFGSVPNPYTGDVQLALPYGSWKFYTSPTALSDSDLLGNVGALVATLLGTIKVIPAAAVTVDTTTTPNSTSSTSGDALVVLDPRVRP